MNSLQTLTLSVAALLAASASARVAYSVRCLTDSVWPGVPAVIEVAAWNTGAAPVEILDLDDPYLSLIGWTWRGAGGAIYAVHLNDYHYLAVPEPDLPERRSLAPDERTSWRVTIPTPWDFQTDTPWLLAAVIRNPDRPSDLATTEVDPRPGAAAGILGQRDPSLLQAALLEDPRPEVLASQLTAEDWEAIGNAAQREDPVARLILFSRALLTGEGVERHWRALEDQPPPLTLLRDYLLLTVPDPLAPAARPSLLAQVDPDSPLRSRYAHAF